MPLSRWWKKWGDLHWSYLLLVLRLILWWGIPKGVLHNAKIFPEDFMVSLGFQAVDNPVVLLHLP
jgi:hypothetical protein